MSIHERVFSKLRRLFIYFAHVTMRTCLSGVTMTFKTGQFTAGFAAILENNHQVLTLIMFLVAVGEINQSIRSPINIQSSFFDGVAVESQRYNVSVGEKASTRPICL